MIATSPHGTRMQTIRRAASHPLDGPGTNQLSKSSEYAVHYHQTSSYLHCFEPVIENFLPAERTPFKAKLADGNGGHPFRFNLGKLQM
jgi:hypothetical protein